MRFSAAVLATVLLAPGAVSAEDAAMGEDAYRAIIERPLFDPTRRMRVVPEVPLEVPVVEAPAEPAPNAGAPVLLGVVTGEGKTIVVVRGGDGRVIRLAEGEAVDGWRIVAVRARAVDIERNGERQSIALPDPGGSTAF